MQNENSNFKLAYLNEDGYSQWDEFVKCSPQGTFFNTIQWADLLSSVYNRPFRILTCVKQSEILAGVIFFENKRLIWKMITPVFLFPFNGPLFQSTKDLKYQKIIADQLHYSGLLSEQLIKDFNYIMLKMHYETADIRSFQWENYDIQPEYSYLFKLENEEQLEKNFNQSLRKKLRKCSEYNARIIESKDWNLFLSLYKSSYTRHKLRPPIKTAHLTTLLEKLLNFDNVRLIFAELDGKIVSGRIILFDDQTIYDLLAGSSDESGLGSSFLVSEIMKKYYSKYAYFDFMGAGHPEIEKFKRGFGGKLVHGFQVSSQVTFPLSLFIKLRKYILQSRRRM
ncbi:GNAT family N-acetyltransferase [Calditrichota bacterium]